MRRSERQIVGERCVDHTMKAAKVFTIQLFRLDRVRLPIWDPACLPKRYFERVIATIRGALTLSVSFSIYYLASRPFVIVDDAVW